MHASISIRAITDPADPRLPGMVRLLESTFSDPNIVLGLDRFQEFLAELAGSERQFHVIVAEDGERSVGAVAFSHVVAANCGFSEYIAVDRAYRGKGVAQGLHAARRDALDADARRMGAAACHGLFVEVEHPERTPEGFVEAERVTALDPWERWRYFHHLGFRRVDVPYVQPPLGPGKAPVDYMDLFFLAWDERARAEGAIPSVWVLDAVKPVWRAWAPDTYAEQHARLRAAVGDGAVALRPLFTLAATEIPGR